MTCAGWLRFVCLSGLLSGILCATWGTNAAAAEEPLSLKHALELTVGGNVDLKRERITIATSEAQVSGARGIFDTHLFSDLTFSRRTTPPLSSTDIAGGFTNTLSGDIGLSRTLETGGNLRLSWQQNSTNTNSRLQCGTSSSGSNADCTFYGANLGLAFSHPLLRGFGAEIVQAGIRRAQIAHDQALLNRQMRAANVLRDVIMAYWELAYATQDLAIRASAVDLAREQLRITKAQIDVGRLAQLDSAAVERAIGDRLQEVALSEQTLFFRTLELRRLFGQPTGAGISAYAAQEMPEASPGNIDVQDEISRALEGNPQLRALRMGQQLSDIDILTALSTLKPQLDFTGQMGSTARTRDLGRTIKHTAGFEDLTWSAGLAFDLPLENRLAKSQVATAELAGVRARLESEDLELGLRDLIVRVVTGVRTATKRVELARATVGFAGQNLEAEKARFSVGRSTNNDVLLRQQELKNAEIQVVRATVDLLNGQTALSAVTGDILERYGMVLKGL